MMTCNDDLFIPLDRSYCHLAPMKPI